MRILNADEVKSLLDMRSCIDAVEAAFRARGLGSPTPSVVAGLPLVAGKLHAKMASLELSRGYTVAKINANVPGNPARYGLPSIQGVVLLFDSATGTPLAALDSGPITSIRTAAATAVAAKWLAVESVASLTMIGCGVQARAHVDALLHVRPITRLRAFDANREHAEKFCADMLSVYNLDCEIADNVRVATQGSQIVVTTTPSRKAILDADDVTAGTFVAGVGADNEDKQELSVGLLRRAAVVVDDIDQCAHSGDLHHAIAAGVLTTSDVRGSLDQIVSERVRGRVDDREIIIFDSTGVAIEDVAAAAIVYEKAEREGVGILADIGGFPAPDPLSARASS
ncbi:MAG TPA: ornithine cyclodeaminase family protein [Gemmatimonadaceae bacterium]|nr:ornithine cyclodeaminase family protein [Gemmatimonadaceae bacterium]